MTVSHERVKLSDLCDLVAQQVDPSDTPEALYVGLEHVEPGRLRRSGSGRAADVHSHKHAFRPDDILYGKLRPYLDKAVLAEESGLCTTELLVLRPKPGVDPKFLACAVHDSAFIDHAVAGVTGAHHPRTSWNHIAQFEIPPHSPQEQRSIGLLLWQINELLIANEGAVVTGAQLKQAAMRELFTRGLRGEPRRESAVGHIPASWSISPLASVAKLERGRFMHRPRNEPRFYGGKTPFIQTGDVVRSRGQIREYTQTLNDDGVAISRVFPTGTILITIAANIGFSGLLQFDAACPDSLIALTPYDQVSNRFLNFYLQTQQLAMDQAAPKGTQKNINIQFLSPWPVPLPSKEEQREIVDVLDVIDRKAEIQRGKREVLEQLFKMLLHKLLTNEIRVDQLDLSAPQAA